MQDRNEKPIVGNELHQHQPADEVVRRGGRPRHKLTELATQHVFFTPALMVQAGQFDRDPVAECCAHADLFDHVVVYDVEYGDIFDDIGWATLPTADGPQTINWNRRIYAVPKEYWDLCRQTMLGIAWVHPLLGTVRTVFQTVKTFIAAEQALLDIGVFCPRIGKDVWLLYQPPMHGRPRPAKSQATIHQESMDWAAVIPKNIRKVTSEDIHRISGGDAG